MLLEEVKTHQSAAGITSNRFVPVFRAKRGKGSKKTDFFSDFVTIFAIFSTSNNVRRLKFIPFEPQGRDEAISHIFICLEVLFKGFRGYFCLIKPDFSSIFDNFCNFLHF